LTPWGDKPVTFARHATRKSDAQRQSGGETVAWAALARLDGAQALNKQVLMAK
jgi:hypothetical protein